MLIIEGAYDEWTVGSGEKWSCVPDHKVKCNIFI